MAQRLGILAPGGRDAAVIEGILGSAGVAARALATMGEAVAALGEGAIGALVLAEEAVTAPALGSLERWLGAQPPWSDLPVILLTHRGRAPAIQDGLARRLGNVTLLERPLHPTSLVAAARAALRARARQHEAERQVEELAAERAALAESEGRLRFLGELDEGLRASRDAWAAMLAAATLLARRLGASRCAYADLDADGDRFVIRNDWSAPGLASSEGTYSLDLFGPRAAGDMRAGRTLVIRDVGRELAPGEGRETFQAIGIEAIVCCPLVREGRLAAMMAVHQVEPRDWGAEEVRLVEAVVERCWAHVERAGAEARLRESEARFRAVFEQAPAGFARTDLMGRFIDVNDRFCRITGRARDELLALRMQDITHPDDLAGNLPPFAAAARGGPAFEIEKRYLRPDGAPVWVRNSVSGMREDGATASSILAVSIDISDRRRAEAALRESEEFNRRVLQASSDCIKVLTLDGRLDFMSEGGMAVMEVEDVGEIRGAFWPDFWPGEERPKALAAIEAARSGGTGRFRGFAPTMKGSPRWWDVAVTPILGEGGRVERLLSVSRDVTDARRAEERLRELNETLERRVAEGLAERRLLADLVEGTDTMVQVVDAELRWLAVNRAAKAEWARVIGRTPRVGMSVPKLLEDLPEQREAVVALWRRALGGEEFTAVEELGDPSRDRRAYEKKFNLLRDAAGCVIGATEFATDVTERLRDQARLAEATARMHEMAKLETLGQLTGGVAHDFNNLLTPIVGALDLLRKRAADDERSARLIDGAMQGAERATVLVQRLLGFARRQHLETRAVDVGALVEGMGDLIRRSIGPLVPVAVEVEPGLPPARVDPNQLELAVLNLAVNARDAMEGAATGEGRIAIRVGAARAAEGGAGPASGDYVRVAVADTGRGMDESTLARAVEPFFTTKEPGKGTGLGLSMIHGLAAQSGGALRLRSRPGDGTVAELWLPVSREAAEAAVEAVDRPEPQSKPATILLVDDDDLVRAATEEMLKGLGHRVLAEATPAGALGVLSDGAEVDLLVSDHLMPEMRGTRLIAEARALRPGLPALLVTGYAQLGEDEAQGVPRLPKPFREADLARQIARLVPAG